MNTKILKRKIKNITKNKINAKKKITKMNKPKKKITIKNKAKKKITKKKKPKQKIIKKNKPKINKKK